MVAVQVGAGAVAAGAGLGAVRVHHRHDPEVHVGGQQLGLRRDVADHVEQGVLAGDLVAVLLGVEQDPERGVPAARRVHEVERPALGRRALDRYGDRPLAVHALEERGHVVVGDRLRQRAVVGGEGGGGGLRPGRERDQREAGQPEARDREGHARLLACGVGRGPFRARDRRRAAPSCRAPASQTRARQSTRRRASQSRTLLSWPCKKVHVVSVQEGSCRVRARRFPSCPCQKVPVVSVPRRFPSCPCKKVPVLSVWGARAARASSCPPSSTTATPGGRATARCIPCRGRCSHRPAGAVGDRRILGAALGLR